MGEDSDLSMNDDNMVGNHNAMNGEGALKFLGFHVHGRVFGISACLIILFIIAALYSPSGSNAFLGSIKTWILEYTDWAIMLGANIFVVFCAVIILLPVGKIRLGGVDARPEYSRRSWIAMLFSAGMGIGLIFWSVAEPIAYYTDWFGTPLNTPAYTPEGAKMALSATMYHWGLHPWAVYGVLGLSLAFFSYNRGLPLTISSVFYPLLGRYTWGITGNIIDILAVFATMFGLATSLGFGAQQVGAGLQFLFGFDNTLSLQLIVIVGIMMITLLSVYRGLNGGIKVLSNINMVMAALLLLFVIFTSSVVAFFNNLSTIATGYAENFVALSSFSDRSDKVWMDGWTVFFWAWWISWSPFVGTFIARVSKGRTVREFIIAVLLIPTAFSMIWMAAFGGTALDQAATQVGELYKGVGDASLTIYQMLDNLPLASITSFLAIVLVMVFFITSADSGALVVDSITAGGKLNTPLKQRMFWGIIQGLIAIVVLQGGGAEALGALQSSSVAMGLPFTIILLFMCVSLYKGLHQEMKKYRT